MKTVRIMKKGGDISPQKAKKILHDGTIRGKKITEKQRRFFGAKSNAENGLSIENNAYTPLSPDTVMLNGSSHANGGQDIAFNGKQVEAEGGEPVTIGKDGSATVFGNLTVPGTNKKFKSVAANIAKKEAKAIALGDKGLALTDNNSPTGKWSSLKFNAGKVMLSGGSQKYKELCNLKDHLSDLQEGLLSMSEEHGLDAPSLSKGVLKRAENGLRINAQNGAKWKYVNTRTGSLDEKIKGFVDLLSTKGYTGYSGPESGVSQRNTKSGHLSRHASGEALDAFLDTPDAYSKVLKDPELSKYLIDNGLTVLNEYDPKVKKQTGADAGHLHIGYDRGTALSNQFRNDAAGLYKATNPTWGWGTSRAPHGKPLKKGISGDAQYDFTPQTFTPGQFKYKNPQQPSTSNPQYPNKFQFTQPNPRAIPSNAEPLELQQVLPELYTLATNKTEPVHLQQFTPELYQPYQVSFQDRLNKNNSTFNASTQYIQDNPQAQATLAGQKYEADNSVLADEFRTNQGIANDITNKNISLLNEAESKNLQLADLQYTRQSQARSNTRAQNFNVLDSISTKLLQRKAENRNLQVYENLYDYRFNPQTGQAKYMGVPGNELLSFPESVNASTGTTPQMNNDQSLSQQFDKTGNLVHSTVSTPSYLKSIKDRISINKEFKYGKPKTLAEAMNMKYAKTY